MKTHSRSWFPPGEVGAGEFWRSGTDYVSGAKTVEQLVKDVQGAWLS